MVALHSTILLLCATIKVIVITFYGEAHHIED